MGLGFESQPDHFINHQLTDIQWLVIFYTLFLAMFWLHKFPAMDSIIDLGDIFTKKGMQSDWYQKASPVANKDGLMAGHPGQR